jgi:hypothetical protein
MSKSTRRPQKIYAVVMWVLSVIFAGILIGLGSLIIKDLPKIDKTVTVEQFIGEGQLADANRTIEFTQAMVGGVEAERDILGRAAVAATEDYRAAQDSLNNWLNARTATEASAQNPAVIARTQQVEELRSAERAALRELEQANKKLADARREAGDATAARADLFTQARPAYNAARQGQALRVFLYRLMLTLPLLVIAGWAAMKKRDSSYWPLYRGFILFALFAFFVELVPYLPSYGGYVRYTVGLIVVLISGHFIIRAMQSYLTRKQMEESRSEGERRQSIEYETALKKIAAKTCPGCDRAIIERDDVETDFCVHCGIRLKEKCGSCGERNISFHRYCLCCGEETAAITGPEAERV